MFSYQNTVGRNTLNCVQDTKHCCWWCFVFLLPPHMLLSFTLFFSFKHKSSKHYRCCWACLPRAAVCTKLSHILGWPEGLFLLPRSGAATGPHLPFFWGDTEGNQVFFWGVAGCLLQNGGLLRVFCSSVPLVAYTDARFVDLCPPEPGWRTELGRRGTWVL